MVRYQFLLVDLSLLLSRNVYAVSRGKEPGEYNAADVVRMTIQTLSKISKDYGILADKIILLADSWVPEYNGYYRTFLLNGNYKDSRSWMTKEMLDSIIGNPASTQEEKIQATRDYYLNEVKLQAKHILKTELGRIGLPCVGVPGLEYDDLCYIFSSILYSSGATKKSLIVTKDSDCMYCTSPAVDYFRLPDAKAKPEIKTYDDIYVTKVPEKLRNRGLSLYEYKSMVDALDGGHNDMRKTKVPRKKVDNVIEKILDGDFSLVSDPDLYQLQYSTFNLSNYPMISEAISTILGKFGTIGHIGSVEEFREFCDKYGITGISDSYYLNFISKFDQKLFSE